VSPRIVLAILRKAVALRLAVSLAPIPARVALRGDDFVHKIEERKARCKRARFRSLALESQCAVKAEVDRCEHDCCCESFVDDLLELDSPNQSDITLPRSDRQTDRVVFEYRFIADVGGRRESAFV
jgi:hypothetical protein